MEQLSEIQQQGDEGQADGVRMVENPVGQVLGLAVEPHLVTKPEPLSDAIRAAQRAARELGVERVKRGFTEVLGVEFPDLPPDTGDARSHVQNAVADLPAELDALRQGLLEVAEGADRIVATDWTGRSADGLVTVHVTGSGEFSHLEVDRFGLRDVDNLTFADTVLEAWRQALDARSVAQGQLNDSIILDGAAGSAQEFRDQLPW
ncbi:YbaB/EbfC family nucleoid-associated protein [Aestuariimicrobium ganziense]|uniref:YbaB/EbfC family nucleoid-associated protein n=1 Tax=Aestuariimicrobium ganziense TaxID=2773677 RepID=UPI0019423582|nr:YbaB/EbfC family nucleoid-associated protein [Aestuariimicrobium ganziense]